MRGLWWENRREVPPSRPRQILASRLPKMHMLRSSPRGHGKILLFQGWDDIMQKRLYENVRVRRRVRSLRASDTSQRIRDENERAPTTAPRLPHKVLRVLQMRLPPHARR